MHKHKNNDTRTHLLHGVKQDKHANINNDDNNNHDDDSDNDANNKG